MKPFFISGIDTGVGKTVATGLMCRYLAARGLDWISVKMVQTGCDGFSEDLDEHRRLAGVGPFPEDGEGLTAPQIFRYPSSPELAARLEGRTLDLDAIRGAVASCAARHAYTLVEGAGGLCVPLTRDTLAVDFAAREGWPLVLVASSRLGSINHIVMSLEIARSRGMDVVGVVYNDYPRGEAEIVADTRLRTRDALRRLGCRPVVVDLEEGADFGELFGL